MPDPLSSLAIACGVLVAALFLARLIPDRYDVSRGRAPERALAGLTSTDRRRRR